MFGKIAKAIPCPSKCSGARMIEVLPRDGKLPYFYVACGCGWEGPWPNAVDDAIAKWNERGK